MKFLQTLAACLCLAFPALAQEDEIQSVISQQIQSFLVDDFETAFGFAAPNIKQIFQTPERFGRMVTQGYPMVHRPSEVTFQDLIVEDGVYTQDVLLRDTKGLYFVARYTMVEANGRWQISGVRVLQAAGVGA